MAAIQRVLNELEAGFYVVPEFQRDFVWRNTQIRDLLASIYNDEPIGAIIRWELPPAVLSDESYRGIFRPLADDIPPENGRYMVIDGLQRLTSLLLIKKKRLKINGKERKIEIYFNPVEQRFELGWSKIKRDPMWFDVHEVINNDDMSEIIEKQAESFGKSKEELKLNPLMRPGLTKLNTAFRIYELPLINAQFSHSDDFLSTFERIAQAYTKLNSKGTRIKMPDLVLALLTAKTRRDIGGSFRTRFKKLHDNVEKEGFDVSEAVIVRAYSAIATGKTRFKDVKDELEKRDGQELMDLLDKTGDAIRESISLLKGLGIKVGRFLQSGYLLVPISYLLHSEIKQQNRLLTDKLKKDLAKWLILASFEKRYTGRLETDLLADIEQIRRGNGVDGLINNLNLKDFSVSLLDEEYEEGNHLALLLMLYNKIGTPDWHFTGGAIPRRISDLEVDELTVHHIFPKEVLERKGFEGQFDHLGNITLISRVANQKIGFRPPKDYLAELERVSPELLEKHFIPKDQELWDIDKLPRFLEERIKLLVSAAESEFGLRVVT